jgi:hypothetical protein
MLRTSALQRLFFPLVMVGLLGCSSAPKPQISSALMTKKTLVWSAPEAKERFSRSFNGDFFSLASFFEPQVNKFNCGPATGTVLLNALFLHQPSREKPVDPSTYPLKENYIGPAFNPSFEKFTQATFFNPKSEKVKSRETFYGKPGPDRVQDGGLMLDQFSRMLEAHGLKTQIFYAESSDAFLKQKSVLIASLKDANSFIAINFDRKVLDQNGGGHISPLVAYDQETDSFLVMDVNPAVTEWFWVDAIRLFASMNSKDGKQYRGFLKVTN